MTGEHLSIGLHARKIDELESTDDISSLFGEWEREEKELQIELERKRQEEEREEYVAPKYLQELMDLLEDNAVEEDMPVSKLPTLVVMGRPNTGKSTLANRIASTFQDGAIVSDEPGITRDRVYRLATYLDYNFQVVDTGGIIFDDSEDTFAERITQQAIIALKEANVAVMVCNGQEGVTQLDQIIADWLRKNIKIPVYIAVNKCESEKRGISMAQEFWSLGLGTPFPVSGIHGSGLAEMLDKVVTHMDKVKNVLKENTTNVALVGRPNVGKSSLLNRLYGQDRSIVSEIAGTTRDAVDVVVQKGVRSYRIIDTAGIRKRGKVEYGPEFFMVNRAFKAIRRADVVVLVLDALQGVVDQDRILAQRIVDEGRGCILALNKWDAVPDKDDKSYIKTLNNIREQLPGLRWAEIILLSALTGQRTEKLFSAVDRSAKQFSRRVPTAVLNEIVSDAVLWMAPPMISGRGGRIYYCLQVSAAPPSIVFFVNDPNLFTDNYKKYLERKIRDALDFEGTPIKMIWRGKSLREVSRAAQKGELRKAVNIALTRSKGQEGGASDGPGSASLTPKRAAIPSASQKK